jgi:hypothetical protein
MRALAVTGTIAFLIAFAARSGDRGLAVRAFVLFLAGLALVWLARRLGSARELAKTSPIADALRPKPEHDERPVELVRIERAVSLGSAHYGDYHARLRPLLREVAAALLARRGVSLDERPDRARELLGDGAWEFVRPDVRRPERPFDPGIPAADLRAAVEALERLAE